MILRRLYLYLVGLASLAALAFGLAALGDTVLLFVFNSPDAQNSRTALAGFSATVAVALPVWAVHMWFAERFALRDPSERASALRHLYIYLACAAASIGAAIAIAATIAGLLVPSLDSSIQAGTFSVSVNQLATAQAAWTGFVLLAIWAFHYWAASADRAGVGEHGASATLRRWYMYIALFIGLLMMLIGAQSSIQLIWLRALHSHQLDYMRLSGPIGQTAAGALLWGFHARALATSFLEEDRRSTLRAVEGFIAIGVSIVSALVGASEILYYAVARALGVENPGNFGNDILAGLAQPGSYVVVYGLAWLLIRGRLGRDAAAGEAARQAGIRRLYTNLVALVSMAVMATGAAGLLGVLAQAAEAPLINVKSPGWKDAASFWVTLLIIGSAVWLAHWRPVPWLEERQSLSRRLYLWAALLVSVLAVLGAGIALLYVVFQQTFSTQPRLDDPANLAFGQSLAVVIVAALVGIYHWRVLRSDASARPARTEPAAPAVAAVPMAPAASEAVVSVPVAPAERAPAPEPVPGRRFELSVVGATEDDVHQALANLPPQASYKLKPADHPT